MAKMEPLDLHEVDDEIRHLCEESIAWVVQLGVFKEKNNALKLVNQLRANGYHAFMANIGDATKVFVGPENQQTAAHTLADRLEQETHLRGIVVNYKPFTL